MGKTGNDWWLRPQRVFRDRIWSLYILILYEYLMKTPKFPLLTAASWLRAGLWLSGDLSCHFSYLAFPKSQASAYSLRFSPTSETLLRRSQSRIPLGLGLSNISLQIRERKKSEWNTELSQTECVSMCLSSAANITSGVRGTSDGACLQLVFFYLCWHGNKLVSLFISSSKVF